MSRSVQLAAAAAGVVIAAAIAFALTPRSDDAGATPWTLRLGMGPRDVRERLARELPGELSVVPADDLTFVWHGVAPDVRALRLELHDGKLVAVRARLAAGNALAHGDSLWQSRTAVLSRAARGDGDVDFLLVARDCPTHRDEVARLLGTHGPSATSP